MVPEALSYPRPEPPPPQVPGYEIEGVLGRGATGVVYRARQLAVEREVALKILHPELTGNARLVRRLQREARTTARLAHPNIVGAIDMGQIDGTWWYAMELVDGSSLALRLRQEGRVNERTALRLFIPLCEALEHLYEHGVVHRDVKPSNILIDVKGRALLADLGLAFADDEPDLTRQGGTLGTPHYISPEQAVDATRADVRSDIWSFGATLFHALCGRPPFAGDSAAEVLSGVLYARIPDPQELEPTLSRGLALVVRKCLARDPEARYQTPRELLLDLERVRERRAPHVVRRTLDPVARGHDPRRVVLGWTVAALGLGAIAFGAVSWLEEGADPGALPVARTDAPNPALEAIAGRVDDRSELLAQHLGELAALEPGLGSGDLARWRELDHELRNRLRDEVYAVRDELDGELRAAIEGGDLATADRLLEAELGRRVRARTGFPLERLEAERVSIEPWIARQRTTLSDRVRIAKEELGQALAAWRRDLLAEVDGRIADQDWSGLRERLVASDATILAEASGGAFRLPTDELEDLLAPLRIELKVQHQRVGQAWFSLDQELGRWVERRTELLRERLERDEPRIRAADELLAGFERELSSRGLTQDKLPTDLPFGARERVEREARELLELEDRLQEQDLRREVEQTERLAAVRRRTREYGAIAGLWDALAARLDALPDDLGSDWRAELARRVAADTDRARALAGLLERVAAAIRRLDGQSIDLRVGSIVHSDRRVIAGVDPLTEGFRIEGLTSRLDVRSLHSDDFERFAAFGSGAEDTYLHALWLASEGRPSAADELLREGPLPEGAGWPERLLDLRLMVSDALDAEAEAARSREEEATYLLGLLTEERIEVSGRWAMESVETLLADYADVPAVREARPRLLALRAELRSREEAAGRRGAEANYAGASVDFPAFDRVRVGFELARADAGALRRGDWVFDGRGWSPQVRATSWDDLTAREGPTLALVSPLDVDAGSFQALLVWEGEANAPPQLLIASVAGFHVALVGTGLPGGEGRARWLVSTAGLDDLARRVAAGEGESVPGLLAHGSPHRLVLGGTRRSGRLSIELDGKPVGRVHLAAPELGSTPVVQVRAWEPVRLLRLEVEAQRR